MVNCTLKLIMSKHEFTTIIIVKNPTGNRKIDPFVAAARWKVSAPGAECLQI